MDLMRGTSVVKEKAGQVALNADLFGLVFESSLEGRILINKGAVRLINERVEQWSGFSSDEVDGHTIGVLLPDIDLVSPDGAIQHVSLMRKQGSPQPVRVILNKVGINGDAYILCTLIEEEFESRRSTTLLESGDRWQTLTSNSPDFIIITNAELKVEYTNRPSPELISSGLVGQSILESIPESSKSHAHGLMMSVLISGEPRYLYTQYETEAFGSVFYETLIVQQKRGVSVSGLMLIARDITRREKQSLELFESRQQLRSVLNGMPIFIGVLSPAGIILDINQAALDALGRPLSDVIGTRASDLEAFTYSDQVHQQVNSAIVRASNGATARFDFLAKVAVDQHLLVHLVISPLYNLSGEVVKLVATGVDISERHRAETALRAAAINLNLAVKAGNVGLWTWDVITDEVFFSDELKAQLGFGPHELENTFGAWEMRLHPEDRERVLSAVRRSVEPPWPPISHEYRLRHKDGSYRWIFAQGSHELNGSGRPAKMYGTHVDITERKNIELALKENERRLQEAQHIAHLGYWQWNMITGEFSWSEEAKNILGYDESAGNPSPEMFLSLIHEEDRPRMKSHIEAVMRKEGVPDVECRVRRPDDSVRFVFTRSKCIYAPNGQITGISGTLQDITERKQVEQALSDSESRYKALVTNSPDFIMTVGLDYRIQFINWHLDGLMDEDIHGHTVFEFVPPDFRRIVADALEKCHETHAIQVYETRGPLPKENPNWYQTRVVPVLQDDAIIGYTLIATDITELKRNRSVIYENEERLRQAINVTRIGIFDHDHLSETIYWSPEQREIFGWTADEEVTLDKYFSQIHPDDRAMVLEAVREAHDPDGEGLFKITHRIVDRTGRVRWLKMISRTKFECIGKKRRPVRTIGAVEDITDRKVAQLLLEESEQRFRIQIDTAPEAIVVFEAEGGKLIDANQNALRLFGQPYDKFLGLVFSDVSPERQPNGKLSVVMAEEMINEVLSGSSPTFEWVYCTPSRGEFICEVRLVHLPYGGRRLIRGSITDITERKQMEKRLIKSEYTLRRAQQVAKIGSWVLHHQGTLEWSEEAYHIFGIMSGTTLSYETFLSLVHPEDKSFVERAWAAAVRGESPYDIIHRIVVSGEIKWLREQAEISLDTDGQFAFAFGTVQDITTQRALQEANLMFDQAQQFAGMGSWRLSITNGEFFWSKSVFELLGYSSDTLVSYDNFMRVIHEKDRVSVESAFEHSKKNREAFEVEYRIRKTSGKISWIAVKGNFRNDRNGSATEMYGVIRDITQEKTHKEELIQARRKAEEAASIKDEFLSVMSHEIRTPLNSVIGLSSLLLKKQPREDQFPLLLTLKKSSDNLWSLINDVLDFNKIQTGNVELEELAFDVPDLLRQIQSSYYPLAMDKGLDLRVTIDPNVPKLLSGDVVRLTQILNNLVNNAIKFTSRGFIRLSVHLATRTATSCTVVFEISDSGIGLTRAQQERLFIPFQQADKDITRKFGGTGLGLSIVKGLVNLMNGEISVTSEPEKGSTFSIRLTFLVPKEKKIKRMDKDRHPSLEKPLMGFSILYVEDVESNQLVVQEILHDLGARCVLADSGKHALKLSLEQQFDVILMDLHMPEMDGYEATKKILRQRQGLNTETAVIAFTADVPSDKLKLKTSGAGIKGIITKPFTNKQIVDKIKEVCPVPLSTTEVKMPILSMDFYENIFNHDPEKLKKIKRVIESDFNQFSKAFLRFDKQRDFEKMRGEIHKILPIAKNLKCGELRSLLEEYRKHKTYNDSVQALLAGFANVMDRVSQSLKSYRY